MAALLNQFCGLRCPPASSSPLSKPAPSLSLSTGKKVSTVVSAYYALTSEQKERQKLKEVFEEAYERCRTAPMEGVAFTVEDFTAALDKYDFDSEIGTKVRAFCPSSFLLFCLEIESICGICCCFGEFGELWTQDEIMEWFVNVFRI